LKQATRVIALEVIEKSDRGGMTPTEIRSLVEQSSTAIGDLPLGDPLVITSDSGATSVIYQGSQGQYHIVCSDGEVIAFLADPLTDQVSGFYNFTPKEADDKAARLINRLVKVEPLSFVVGYMSVDRNAVSWKLFRTGQSDLRLLTRWVAASNPPHGQGEIMVGNVLVGFRHKADGTVHEICMLTQSELQGLYSGPSTEQDARGN
jgi:hypothetical protein